MGRWHATCTLTRSPIFEDEDVVMVVPSERISYPRNLASSPYNYLAHGGIELVEFGKYDHFGGIKGLELNTHHIDWSFFFLKEAWDAVPDTFEMQWGNPITLKWAMNDFEEHDPWPASDEVILQFLRVLHFCRSNRIVVCDDDYAGSQHKNDYAYDILVELMSKRAPAIKGRR